MQKFVIEDLLQKLYLAVVLLIISFSSASDKHKYPYLANLATNTALVVNLRLRPCKPNAALRNTTPHNLSKIDVNIEGICSPEDRVGRA